MRWLCVGLFSLVGVPLSARITWTRHNKKPESLIYSSRKYGPLREVLEIGRARLLFDFSLNASSCPATRCSGSPARIGPRSKRCSVYLGNAGGITPTHQSTTTFHPEIELRSFLPLRTLKDKSQSPTKKPKNSHSMASFQ